MRTDTSTPSFEMMNETGSTMNESPVGMKKLFPTVFHSSAENLAAMIVSAGKIGYQVELAPHDLAALVRAKFADIIVE